MVMMHMHMAVLANYHNLKYAIQKLMQNLSTFLNKTTLQTLIV